MPLYPFLSISLFDVEVCNNGLKGIDLKDAICHRRHTGRLSAIDELEEVSPFDEEVCIPALERNRSIDRSSC